MVRRPAFDLGAANSRSRPSYSVTVKLCRKLHRGTVDPVAEKRPTVGNIRTTLDGAYRTRQLSTGAWSSPKVIDPTGQKAEKGNSCRAKCLGRFRSGPVAGRRTHVARRACGLAL